MPDKWWDNVSVQVGARGSKSRQRGYSKYPIRHGNSLFLMLLRPSAKKLSEDREHAVIKLHSRESGWAIIGKGTIAMLEACLTLPFLLVFHEFSREFASPWQLLHCEVQNYASSILDLSTEIYTTPDREWDMTTVSREPGGSTIRELQASTQAGMMKVWSCHDGDPEDLMMNNIDFCDTKLFFKMWLATR